LEQNREAIEQQGLGLAAISYDGTEILKAFADRLHIGFKLLSDPESKTIRAYGILNETVEKGTMSYGIPHPGTYLLDPRGVVVAKYFDEDYRVRDTAESILFRRFGLAPPPHESVAGKHIRLATTGGAETLRPGQRVTLAVEAELPARMHVYAPGVSGYIPISLNMVGSAAFKPDPVTYPASKTMRLEAIQETVPVFEGRFRILQTVTLAGQRELEPLLDPEGNLTLQADLRYQACDDRECFVPETLRVKWKIHVVPFDRTRAPETVRHK
jgi:hypothetical protein